MENQVVRQAVLVAQENLDPSLGTEPFALFNDDGTPVDFTGVATTGAAVALTGYTSGDPDPVEATDSVNEAIAKLEAQVEVDPVGSDVLLTGYTSGSVDDVEATDSVNEAIAKLEARLAALEA